MLESDQGASVGRESSMTFVDAGGRYGPQPNIKNLLAKGLARVYAFEPDPEEFNYLKESYKDLKGYHVYNFALGEANKTALLNLTRHRGQCSIYEPDMETQWFSFCRPHDGAVNSQVEIQIKRLDEWLISHNKKQAVPNFLKSDTEGSELSIFKGAGNLLHTFYGICAEVHFEPVYRSAPTFADVHEFLLARDYKLLNLSYDGRGNPHSYFTPDNQRYGTINGVDAIYLRSEDFIRSTTPVEMLKIVLFMLLNHAADYAFSILSDRKDAIHAYLGTGIADEIEILILKGIKKLENIPTTQFRDASKEYSRIFCREFPSMHNFYPTLKSLEDKHRE